GMRVADPAVQADAELVAERRGGSSAAKSCKVGGGQRRGDDPSLLVALPVSKEEETVAADGTAEGESELPALEKWIGVSGIAIEPRIRRQLMVAEEIQAGAVKVISAGARDYVDCAYGSHAGGKIETNSR